MEEVEFLDSASVHVKLHSHFGKQFGKKVKTTTTTTKQRKCSILKFKNTLWLMQTCDSRFAPEQNKEL